MGIYLPLIISLPAPFTPSIYLMLGELDLLRGVPEGVIQHGQPREIASAPLKYTLHFIAQAFYRLNRALIFL